MQESRNTLKGMLEYTYHELCTRLLPKYVWKQDQKMFIFKKRVFECWYFICMYVFYVHGVSKDAKR